MQIQTEASIWPATVPPLFLLADIFLAKMDAVLYRLSIDSIVDVILNKVLILGGDSKPRHCIV